jgi:hypothetical protein
MTFDGSWLSILRFSAVLRYPQDLQPPCPERTELNAGVTTDLQDMHSHFQGLFEF